MVSIEIRQRRIFPGGRQGFDGTLGKTHDIFNCFNADVAGGSLARGFNLNKHAHFINLIAVMLG